MPSPVGSSFSTKAVSTTRVSLTDNTGYAVFGDCEGSPDTTASIYQHGCIMISNDTGTGSNGAYQNTGSIAVPVWTLLSSSVGALLSASPTAGVGYTTGAGGTVTQTGASKGSQVTLNKVAGQITIASAALATNPVAGFTLVNTAILATDTINLSIATGATVNAYRTMVDTVIAGSAHISISNISGLSLSETLVMNYAIVRGASS